MELWLIVRIHPGTPKDAIGPDLQGRTPSSARQQGSTAAGTGNQAHGGATVPHPGAKPFKVYIQFVSYAKPSFVCFLFWIFYLDKGWGF